MSRPISRRYFTSGVPAAALALTTAELATAAPASSAAPGARTYDVREYGAKGDGATLDTAAVQSAIDACAKDKGGTVLIPAGDYVVGTIELKSNAGEILGRRRRAIREDCYSLNTRTLLFLSSTSTVRSFR